MRRAGGWLLAAGAITLPLWLQSPYHLHVAIMAGIFGVLAMSLNLLLGYTGQLSLGRARRSPPALPAGRSGAWR